jgi:AraC-like DNA-binding protein
MTRGPKGTVSARLALRLLAFCGRRGCDEDRLCRAAGLTRESLSAAEARLPWSSLLALGEHALAAVDDPDFGLHLAEMVGDPGHYDAGVLLLLASPTVRAAFTQMVKNQRYWGDGDRYRLVPERRGIAVRYSLVGVAGAYARHADECAMAEVTLGVRAMTGRPVAPAEVTFRHAAPARLATHGRIFGAQVTFGAPRTEIVFDHAALDTPLAHANAMFCAVFARQVEQAMARLPAEAGASGPVRAAVQAALLGGDCTLSRTARALGTSGRSLQRRLREEGTSFAAIVDALRRELAESYLDHGLPLPEVARRLGYADTTAFHRAHRRWTGRSPRRAPDS